ncbi:hypothetical protein F5B22DRAFT_638338 [Xylaria bambusicola]|uniref:uncharacterized protein n=1 Tax=Xylaria bambusicola TaxID=326684 RepID=UPI0020076604|nr:uncharacterized protein F5B22DRAFT_638338 [Xylaria bambusicola]KAI0508949.1 hypothetical protein F5B22DRAFT_638338 [Xylaria bambusicola]
MQTKLFVALLFFLVTKVLAGGYQGALERVWLFYAYQIDGLNEPSDQTLGWKCLKWDTVKEECKSSKKGSNGWVMCKGTAPGKRCTFSELTNFLGGTGRTETFMADSKGNTLPLTDTHPDPEETAKRVLTHYLATPKGNVQDWAGYKFILAGKDNYVNSLRKVASVVTKAGSEGKNTGTNKAFFEMFAATTTQIKNARIGDTGPYLIARAEDKLHPRGITVYTESISPGHSPADPTRIWKTVDWEKTMSQAVASGKFTKGQIMQITAQVRSDYYKDTTDTRANEHRVVIKAFKTAETKAKGCL